MPISSAGQRRELPPTHTVSAAQAILWIAGERVSRSARSIHFLITRELRAEAWRVSRGVPRHVARSPRMSRIDAAGAALLEAVRQRGLAITGLPLERAFDPNSPRGAHAVLGRELLDLDMVVCVRGNRLEPNLAAKGLSVVEYAFRRAQPGAYGLAIRTSDLRLAFPGKRHKGVQPRHGSSHRRRLRGLQLAVLLAAQQTFGLTLPPGLHAARRDEQINDALMRSIDRRASGRTIRAALSGTPYSLRRQ